MNAPPHLNILHSSLPCFLPSSLPSFPSLLMTSLLHSSDKSLFHHSLCPVHVRVLSCFNCVILCTALWTVALQAPLSKGFSRQECWSGLPCPPPGDLPHPGIEPVSLMSPALADGFFNTNATWEAPYSPYPSLSFFMVLNH